MLRFAYNSRFAGYKEASQGRPRLSVARRGAQDDFGRERNSETVAASLSVSDDRRNSGDGAAQEHRRREKRDDQRAIFSGPLFPESQSCRGC